jgi:hypothetical protein
MPEIVPLLLVTRDHSQRAPAESTAPRGSVLLTTCSNSASMKNSLHSGDEPRKSSLARNSVSASTRPTVPSCQVASRSSLISSEESPGPLADGMAGARIGAFMVVGVPSIWNAYPHNYLKGRYPM